MLQSTTQTCHNMDWQPGMLWHDWLVQLNHARTCDTISDPCTLVIVLIVYCITVFTLNKACFVAGQLLVYIPLNLICVHLIKANGCIINFNLYEYKLALHFSRVLISTRVLYNCTDHARAFSLYFFKGVTTTWAIWAPFNFYFIVL